MSNKLITFYADALSLDEETVRAIFLSCIDSLYNGDDEAFLDDVLDGFVATENGKVNSITYFDHIATFAWCRISTDFDSFPFFTIIGGYHNV